VPILVVAEVAYLLGTRVGPDTEVRFLGDSGPGETVALLHLADGADGLVLVTEWSEFRHLDLARVQASMRKAVMVDGRNIYDPAMMRGLGFTYRGIGRG